MRFEIGDTYRNRKQEYTVLEVKKGGLLLVRYNDGSVGQLHADVQCNIIENMAREKK